MGSLVSGLSALQAVPGEHQIPYKSINIEKDPEAEKFVLEKNKGRDLYDDCFPDGSSWWTPAMRNWPPGWD